MKFLLMLTAALVVITISSVPVVEALTKPSAVKLENNEYTGIVVAIHEGIPVNSELIDAIKRMFVKASPYLYNATKKRAYFKEVTILVPPSWPDDASYQSATSETFDAADILVAPRNPRFSPDDAAPGSPYTKHFEGCGKQAMYIHFTPEFLMDNSLEDTYGSFGRVLVHEWGHFRWGLFNEYPDPVVDGRRTKYFYYSTRTRLFEPVACPRLWSMTALKYTGDNDQPYTLCNGNSEEGYEKGCISIPDDTQPEFSASIMFGRLNLEQVTQFCDNDTDDEGTLHNSEAANKQNRLCEGKSSWEVMREHDDFRDGANAAREIDDVQPTFKVVRVKQSGRPVVLVLDTSGSMGANDRANRLASAVRNYLTSTVSEGCKVGIIDFDNTGKILSTLTAVSDSTRQQLANLIVGDANGGTCIGCGIESALSIIPSDESGKIVLVTDGEDGNIAFINQMQEQCINRGIIVDSIAYSDSAQENIVDLARNTGGKFYLQTDDPTSTGASDAYNENSACSGSSSSSSGRITLMTKVFELTASDSEVRDSVTIDSTIGNETKFIFSYYQSNEAIQVTLTSPSNQTLDSNYEGYERREDFKKITFSINGVAEAGSWVFAITNQDGSAHTVAISVSSLPSQEGVEPIVIRSFLSGTDAEVTTTRPLVAYAEVTQGFYAIIHARVIATIERPRTADGRDLGPIEIVLKDNGGGFDVTKNDGIYTKSFTRFTGVGYYGISLRVENNGEAEVLRPTGGSRIDPYFSPEELLKGKVPLHGYPDPYVSERPSLSSRAPNFTRSVSAGAARVSETPVGWTPESDVLPPSKISDLSVSSVDFQSATVTISFTSPGDDFDTGTAACYVILRSTSFDQLKRRDLFKALAIDNVDVEYGNLSSPSEFGTEETFAIRVPIQEDQTVASFFFAVFAEDEQGLTGKLSNIVQATLRKQISLAFEERDVSKSNESTSDNTKHKADTNGNLVRCKTEHGWMELNKHCYKMLYNKGKDFDAMLDVCRREGPQHFGQNITGVAYITSNAENDFVANTVAGGNRAWIGAKREKNGRFFKWMVGEDDRYNPSVDRYTNWDSNQPDNQANVASCIQINRGSSGTWDDIRCRRRLPIICKYSLSRVRA